MCVAHAFKCSVGSGVVASEQFNDPRRKMLSRTILSRSLHKVLRSDRCRSGETFGRLNAGAREERGVDADHDLTLALFRILRTVGGRTVRGYPESVPASGRANH
jgi:hypothetical protein